MSRLKDALMSLLGKCTPAGTPPVGNNVDEIVECIARHYIGKPYIVYLTWNEYRSRISSDRGYKETSEAFAAGRPVYAVDNFGCVWSPWCFGENFAQFMHLQSNGSYYVAKLRDVAGECDIVYADFDSPSHSNYLVTVTSKDGVYTADKTFAEIREAVSVGKVVRCMCDGSYYDIVSSTSNVVRFSRVLHRVSDDATTIAEMSLIAVEINPANGVLVVGRGITTI